VVGGVGGGWRGWWVAWVAWRRGGVAAWRRGGGRCGDITLAAAAES